MTWVRPCLQVSDCRFGVSPVNYPDPEVDSSPLTDFLTKPEARIHNEKQTIVLSHQTIDRRRHRHRNFIFCRILYKNTT